jgi:sugar lactone lactonase YvrE
MNPVKIALALVLVLSNGAVWSKNPPPGTGSGDVKANILFMLDTSGSMRARTSRHAGDPRYPNEVAVDSQGSMWVSSQYYRDIKKYDSSGTYISKFNNKVSGYNYDRHMAVDSSDNLYITNNNQVLKYDSNGAYLKTFTGLSSPHGLAVDPAGNVYAGNNTTIMKWNSSGTVVKQWSSQANNDGLAYYNGSLYSVNL